MPISAFKKAGGLVKEPVDTIAKLKEVPSPEHGQTHLLLDEPGNLKVARFIATDETGTKNDAADPGSWIINEITAGGVLLDIASKLPLAPVKRIDGSAARKGDHFRLAADDGLWRSGIYVLNALGNLIPRYLDRAQADLWIPDHPYEANQLVTWNVTQGTAKDVSGQDIPKGPGLFYYPSAKTSGPSMTKPELKLLQYIGKDQTPNSIGGVYLGTVDDLTTIPPRPDSQAKTDGDYVYLTKKVGTDFPGYYKVTAGALVADHRVDIYELKNYVASLGMVNSGISVVPAASGGLKIDLKGGKLHRYNAVDHSIEEFTVADAIDADFTYISENGTVLDGDPLTGTNTTITNPTKILSPRIYSKNGVITEIDKASRATFKTFYISTAGKLYCMIGTKRYTSLARGIDKYTSEAKPTPAILDDCMFIGGFIVKGSAINLGTASTAMGVYASKLGEINIGSSSNIDSGLLQPPVLTMVALAALPDSSNGTVREVRIGTTSINYTYWKGEAGNLTLVGQDSDDGLGRWVKGFSEGLRGKPVADEAALIKIVAKEYERRLNKANGREYVFILGADLTPKQDADPTSVTDAGKLGKWVWDKGYIRRLALRLNLLGAATTVKVAAAKSGGLKVDIEAGVIAYFDEANNTIVNVDVPAEADATFTVIGQNDAVVAGTAGTVISDPQQTLTPNLYETDTASVLGEIVIEQNSTYVSFYMDPITKKVYSMLGSVLYSDLDKAVNGHIVENKVLPATLKNSVFIGGFLLEKGATILSTSGRRVQPTKNGEINIGLGGSPMKGAPSDILIGQLFYDTAIVPMTGKLYASNTYNWSDNPKLQAMFLKAPHEFITDNKDGTFTIADSKEFIRAGVTDIGKKVEDSTSPNGLALSHDGRHQHKMHYSDDQNSRVNPGFNRNAMCGDAWGSSRNAQWNHPTYADMDQDGRHNHIVTSTDTETAPVHRAAYFGVYGDMAVVVLDTKVTPLPTLPGVYSMVVDAGTGIGSFIKDVPVEAKDVVFDPSTTTLTKDKVQTAIKELSDRVDKLPGTTYEDTFADLPGDGAKSDFCHIADASGDPTVTTGWAKYEHNGTAWVKSSSQEELYRLDATITDVQLQDVTDETVGNLKGGKALHDREVAMLMAPGDIVTGTVKEPKAYTPELLNKDVTAIVKKFAVEVFDPAEDGYTKNDPYRKYVLYTDGILYEAQEPNVPAGTDPSMDVLNWLPMYDKKPKKLKRELVDVKADIVLEYYETDDVHYQESKRYVITSPTAVISFPGLAVGSVMIAADWKARAKISSALYVTKASDTIVRLTTGKSLTDADNQVLPMEGHGFVEFIADPANNRWIVQY